MRLHVAVNAATSRWHAYSKMIVCVALVFVAHINRANAQNWASATSGNWSTAARWDPAVVPSGPGALVNIDATGADYTVTLDSFRFANRVTINSANATFNHTGSTLATGQINVLNGLYRLNGGTIAGATIDPTNFLFFSGTLQAAAIVGDLNLDDRDPSGITLKNDTTVSGNINLSNNGGLFLEQDFTITSGKSINVGASDGSTVGKIENPVAFVGRDHVLKIDAGGTLNMNSGSVLSLQTINNGTLNAATNSASAFFSTHSTFENNGQVNVSNQHQLEITALTNNSDVNVSDKSILSLTGEYDNSNGHINVDSTSRVHLDWNRNISTFGDIHLESGGIAFMTHNGWFTNDVGTFAPGQGWQISQARITGGTLDVTDFKFIHGELQDMNVIGDFHTNGGYVRLVSGISGVTISSPVIDINGGTFQSDDSFTLHAGQTMSMGRDPTFTGLSILQVYGTSATFDVGSALVGSGLIINPVMNGQIHVDGTVSPGTDQYPIGTFEVRGSGSVIFGSTALTEIQLGTNGIDRFIGGSAPWILDGNLHVSLIDGFAPTDGAKYQFMDLPIYSGTFNGLEDGDLVGHFGSHDLFIQYNSSGAALLSVAAVPEPSSMIAIAIAGGIGIYVRRKRFRTQGADAAI